MKSVYRLYSHLLYSSVISFILFSCSEPNLESGISNGTTYYVSSSGDDSNNGTSPDTPWKSLDKINSTVFSPGDSVLLSCGDIWEGQLAPKGSGSTDMPIYIGSYGEGRKPYISGNGINGLLGGAVLLYNQDYWHIENLDISNMPVDGKNDVRFGILVRWHDYGTGRGIRINGCDIHDVAGVKSGRFHGDGIMVISTGKEVQTNYENVVIENCVLRNIDRTGINIWSQWHKRFDMDYGPSDNSKHYHGSSGPYKASKGVIVRGNYLENIAGDGILVSCTHGAVIERNRVYKANQRGTDPNAGIWPHNSDSVLIQYNEVSHTGFSGDGQGFDIDMLCFDCISQYNFSHDNSGGFYLVCSQGSKGRSSRNIIRYNKSVNDKRHIFSFAGSIDSTYIYGNEIVTGGDGSLGMFTSWAWDNGKPSNTFIYDNKFIYTSGGENTLKDTINFVCRDNIWSGDKSVVIE